jgi:hypothetical protein
MMVMVDELEKGIHTASRGSRWTNAKYQKAFIKHMEKTKMSPQQTSKFFGRMVPVRTLRKWWSFYCKFGDVPAQRSQLLRKAFGPKRYQTNITAEHIAILKGIVDDHPEFYLDEIYEEFLRLRPQGCTITMSASTLWRRLCRDCGYSLKAVTYKAAQADAMRRADFHERMSMYPQKLWRM